MPTLHHLYHHVKQYGNRHRFLYLVSLAIFFLMVFDGIVAYVVPILISDRGFSLTALGWIVGSSSMVGAVVDILLSRFVPQVRFRLFFFVAFIFAALYVITAFRAQSAAVFVLAMALWGIYWDLYVFGSYDFVGRYTQKDEHASSFGVMMVFVALGGLVAPIIAAGVLEDGGRFAFLSASLALVIAATVFGLTVFAMRGHAPLVPEPRRRVKRFLTEVSRWKLLGKVLRKPILLIFLLHSFNGLFWTLAPLYPFAAFEGGANAGLLIAYSLPALLAGWFVGSLTARWGKKRIAFGSFAIGALVLAGASLIQQPLLLVAGVFCASFFLALAMPAISGAYADYISEVPDYEEDIEGIQDFFANMGYVVSPIAAGMVSDAIGIPLTFTVFGAVGAVAGFLLLSGAGRDIRIQA